MDKKRKRFISGMLAAIVLLTSTPVYASEATGLNREPYNLYVEDTDEPLEESHILTIPEPQTESEAQAGNDIVNIGLHFFSRMFDLMLPPVAKHSIVVA